MTYEETLNYLYTSQPAFHIVGAAAYKPGLDNTVALMHHLDNPHERFRSIHIAGTNGKGSTSHLIAASLQCAGLKVGLYTSPHLVDFRERIRINGQMIPREDVVNFVETNKAFLDEVKPSFFETTMAMAFDYFARERVDVAVVEVGLGGRLDSTNILAPYTQPGGSVVLSVITNIGMDHTEFLGDTLAEIASEKAGIIKNDVPCVIGETDAETAPVFIAKAQECGLWGDGLETAGCKVWFADQCCYLERRRAREVPDCELQGIYQEHNMQTAYVALRSLTAEQLPSLASKYLPLRAIREGFAHVCSLTGLRGRWEIISRNPLTICDTGHNSHGIKFVSQQLRNLSCSHLRMVFGMVDDKDVDVVMRLLPQDALYYFTQASTHRAIPASKMSDMAQTAGLHTYGIFSSVASAVSKALEDSNADDVIFIGGSNYVVGEALHVLG